MAQNLQDLLKDLYYKQCATLDASDNLVDNPLEKNLMVQLQLQMKSKQLQMLSGQHAIKDAWKAKLIADKHHLDI